MTHKLTEYDEQLIKESVKALIRSCQNMSIIQRRKYPGLWAMRQATIEDLEKLLKKFK